MANNKKLLYFYEGSVNRGTEESRWFYAVPRPNGVQYDVYELNFKGKNYNLVKADDVTFNYNAKKFSVKTDTKALKRKFNSFTIKNPIDGTPKAKMYFFENTRGMEVFFADSNETQPQELEFQYHVKDSYSGNVVPFNDSNYFIFNIMTDIVGRKEVFKK